MPTGESLTTRTTRAAQWRLAAAAVGAGSQLLVGIVLAHLLTPADFGVAALAYVVLGLAQPLGDLGLGAAVVRRIDLTDRHIRTAFTCSVVVGLSIAASMALAAPLGAAVMRDARVAPVLRLLATGIALRAAAVVADALLRRRLDFRRQFAIETASYAVGFGVVAIPLAMSGQGVWSLVWGGLVQTLIASVAQLRVVRHPMRPLLAPRELEELLGYGLGAALSGCVNYVALNGDYFVIGRLMGAFNLGLYSRAYSLMNLPHTYAAGVMSGVMFPAFAQVQDEPARVRSGYLLVTRLTAMIAAPAMAILAVAAPAIVRGLYGPQWIGAAVPLQILAIAGYFRALYHLGGIVAQSLGRVYGELWRQATYAAAVVAGTLVGSRYGLPGVAVGVGAAILYMFVATGHLALQATGTPWRVYARVQTGALLTAAITGAVALFVRLLLEAAHAASAAVALGVLAASAVPWCAGLLWTLAEPEFEPLRRSLPLLGTKTNRRHVLLERVNTRHAVVPAHIRLFSKCRNERLRLPAFLDHYRRLGVGAFFIVDNDSSDGTTEYLAAQPDVQLFRTTGRFSEARGGTDWLNALLREFGTGSWSVTVDVDELLVYPGSEEASLRTFTGYLDRNGYDALSCLLLDLYPAGPLHECSYEPGGDLLAAAPYFDGVGYERSPSELCPGALIRGGMRQRVFYPAFDARAFGTRLSNAIVHRTARFGRDVRWLRWPSPPCLTKVPLVRWDPGTEYLDCNHWISNKIVAPDTGALLHFKFLHDFHERALLEAARGEYFDGASEYRRYARELERNPGLTLANDASLTFEGTTQLVRLGLVRDTEAWTDARAASRRSSRQTIA